jgi:raffinose/stachyose/melibiose transport system substrate-binding protein
VGSGIRSAAEGAALYDEDVKKQALQLGLPGWN